MGIEHRLSENGFERRQAKDTAHTLRFEVIFKTTPKARLVGFPKRPAIWIPKSVCEEVDNRLKEIRGAKEWFVEKEDLWQYSI